MRMSTRITIVVTPLYARSRVCGYTLKTSKTHIISCMPQELHMATKSQESNSHPAFETECLTKSFSISSIGCFVRVYFYDTMRDDTYLTTRNCYNCLWVITQHVGGTLLLVGSWLK